ncbi:MAG TPA: response regulator, partial [Verrucomicrobiae bacterium]|nr:response regulator [Verrucomicrobiae bacterium]
MANLPELPASDARPVPNGSSAHIPNRALSFDAEQVPELVRPSQTQRASQPETAPFASAEVPPGDLRVLIIDDTPGIHEDFRKILAEEKPSALESTEQALFGDNVPEPLRHGFEVESAYQGQEGLALVEQAVAEGRPFALAFVDIRMPPGWDGIETISRLWAADPNLQVVVATAYSDYSWAEIARRFGAKDNLLILKKPFDNVEVLQLTYALTTKWLLMRDSRLRLRDLDRMVAQRTEQLDEAARHILRLNRLYSVLTKSNELVVRTRSLDHLCEQACRIAVEDGLFRVAWVGLLEPESLEIKPLAHWGVQKKFLETIRISADERRPEGQGPAGTACREGRYNICNDARNDPRLSAWRSPIEES